MRARVRAAVVTVALITGALVVWPSVRVAAAVPSPAVAGRIDVTPLGQAAEMVGMAAGLGSAGVPGPVTLTIKTAPPVPGVRLSMDGQTLVTDDAGTASVTQPHNLDPHSLTLLDTRIENPDQRYTFARWAGQRDPDEAFTPSLNGVTMRANDTVTAAFTVERSVTPAFVDQNGEPIDPGSVSSATVRSDNGATITIAPAGPTWLEDTRVNYRANAPLELREVSYSWQTVIVAGANVVDSGRQSFTPATTPQVTVQGEFHDLTIVGSDALLGYGIGSEATVTFPDGTVKTISMDGVHTAVFAHLPRGTYQAQVKAGSSIVAGHQIRLSRDSTLSVPVISLVDVTILLGSLLLAAVTLVLIGRRGVRRRIMTRFRPAIPAKVGAL